MDHGTGWQTHGGVNYTATGVMVGSGHPEYQPMPVGSPGAAYIGSAIARAGNLEACTWGAAYGEHLYYT
jgi:hypothetical protein